MTDLILLSAALPEGIPAGTLELISLARSLPIRVHKATNCCGQRLSAFEPAEQNELITGTLRVSTGMACRLTSNSSQC